MDQLAKSDKLDLEDVDNRMPDDHTRLARSTSILLEYINTYEETREGQMHWREHRELRGMAPVADPVE